MLEEASYLATALGFPIAIFGGYLAFRQYSSQSRYQIERDFEQFLPKYTLSRSELYDSFSEIDHTNIKAIDTFIKSASDVLIMARYIVQYSRISKNPVATYVSRLATDIAYINHIAKYLENETSDEGITLQIKEYLPSLVSTISKSEAFSNETKTELLRQVELIVDQHTRLDPKLESNREGKASILVDIGLLQQAMQTAISTSELIPSTKIWLRVVPYMERTNGLQHLIFESREIGNEVNKFVMRSHSNMPKHLREKIKRFGRGV